MYRCNTLVLTEPGKFIYESRKEKEPAQDEVLVQIKCMAVCGSDIHAINGRMKLFTFPRVLGHEISGVVIKTGEQVRSFQPGDSVVLMPCISCGKCLACRHGKTNACSVLRLYGVHEDGGLQEYITLPEKYFLKVPKGITSEHAALVEPFTIGMHSVRKLETTTGDQVLILGAGPIGVCCAMILRAIGACPYLADISEERRRFVAERFGFTVLDPLAKDYHAQIDEITDHEKFYGIIDCTANKHSMDHAYELIGNGGRIVFLGISPGDLQMDEAAFHMKESSLLINRNSVRKDFEDVLDMMRSGKLPANQIDGMITHRTSFDDAKEALLAQAKNPSAFFKHVIIVS